MAETPFNPDDIEIIPTTQASGTIEGPVDIVFEDGPDDAVDAVEGLSKLSDLGEILDFNDEGNGPLGGDPPEPGVYRTSQTVAPGEIGDVAAKVYYFGGDAEVLDTVTGEPLAFGETVVQIGSAGPIKWDTFRMLHRQSGGRYSPGITLGPEDFV